MLATSRHRAEEGAVDETPALAQPRAPSQVIEDLRQQLFRWAAARRGATGAFTSGSSAVDRLMPAGALERGTLIECLADDGSGASALALMMARQACREGGALVVIDRQFYPPAAANLGIDLAHTIFVRPRTRNDELWAMHQAASCPGVAAVLCRAERLNDRAFRTLQLAAETSGVVVLLMRPPGVRGKPSWSDVQLLIEPLTAGGAVGGSAVRRLRVEVLRCRGGKPGASVEVELDDETGTLEQSRRVHLAPKLAGAASAHGSAGA